jgi:hypothetical protein
MSEQYHGTIVTINGWVLVQSSSLMIYAHDPEGHTHHVLSGGRILNKDNAFKFLCAIDRDIKNQEFKPLFRGSSKRNIEHISTHTEV